MRLGWMCAISCKGTTVGEHVCFVLLYCKDKIKSNFKVEMATFSGGGAADGVLSAL